MGARRRAARTPRLGVAAPRCDDRRRRRLDRPRDDTARRSRGTFAVSRAPCGGACPHACTRSSRDRPACRHRRRRRLLRQRAARRPTVRGRGRACRRDGAASDFARDRPRRRRARRAHRKRSAGRPSGAAVRLMGWRCGHARRCRSRLAVAARRFVAHPIEPHGIVACGSIARYRLDASIREASMPKRALAVLGLVFTCASAAQTPIAIETLFRRPDYGSMQLSPDATKLATVMVSHGRYNLAIIDLATRQARAITAFDDADVVRYVWIGGGRLLLDLGEMHDASGRERISSAVAVDADGGVQYRTRFASSSVLYRFFDSGDVIVSARGPGRDDTQAWRASTRSNERTLLTGDNPGHVGRWIVDQAGNVRVAIGYDRAERQQVFHHRSDVGAPWKEFARFNIASRENFVPLGFDFDGKTLFVTSNIGADRRAIYRYDPETGKFLDKLLESARVDVTNLIVDRHAKRVIGAYSDEADAGDIWLDAQLQRVQNGVNQALPGLRNRLSSGSLNRTRMLITSSSDVQPAKYWLLDVESGRLEELASSRKWIDSKIMTPAKRMSYKSRDGLDIPAAMMVPATASGHKPPLVVMIHGGPNASGYGHGFNEEAQFFASRGYAVLMPDFRGTTGYGRSFVEAGDRQWGRAMQDDITDGVRWAIDQGIVDAARVFVRLELRRLCGADGACARAPNVPVRGRRCCRDRPRATVRRRLEPRSRDRRVRRGPRSQDRRPKGPSRARDDFAAQAGETHQGTRAACVRRCRPPRADRARHANEECARRERHAGRMGHVSDRGARVQQGREPLRLLSPRREVPRTASGRAVAAPAVLVAIVVVRVRGAREPIAHGEPSVVIGGWRLDQDLVGGGAIERAQIGVELVRIGVHCARRRNPVTREIVRTRDRAGEHRDALVTFVALRDLHAQRAGCRNRRTHARPSSARCGRIDWPTAQRGLS